MNEVILEFENYFEFAEYEIAYEKYIVLTGVQETLRVYSCVGYSKHNSCGNGVV
jgi:hypothetical protein